MAIPKTIHLEVVTPDGSVVHEDVDEIQLPGADGYLGILPGHTPLLTLLQVGEFWYRKGTEKTFLTLAFGVAEILPDRVTILARVAERPEDIDVQAAEADRREAEKGLGAATSEADLERARAAMMTAMMRLKAAERARIRRGA